ncbi:MmgE/PrpD family protein [Achromobacter insolitus]|uniref:MmgE/PrpD family protein n=1 Tax=Achromobacter insolitus TaxID=217204 RepID=UPI0027E0AFDF|nr:MmgE/PrpD family protein [Achromobacter insolitus]MDQ6213471.1 MmgE/PrpD family protein [Achromobacter insolitus]
MTTAALAIARYAVGRPAAGTFAFLSREVGRALIDTVGVGIAGRHEPVSTIALQYGAACGGAPQAQAWGWRDRLSPEAAAFCNGVAGHVLDYDDVSSPLRGHPSIALLPPLVALAQARDLAGGQLVDAYVVGFEIIVKLARAMVHEHYAKGWHATATLGTVAAAVACARLLDLTEMQTVHAIGIAVGQAAGTRANFGTMAKSFQAGHCAASGLRAALLAELGMDAAADALDGPQGFMRLYGQDESLAPALAGLGVDPPELASSGIEIKKYPLCYATHRSLDGILDLRREHGLTAQDVESVHIESNHRGMVPLIHDSPATGLEAKFSMPYAISAALLDGRINFTSFTDEAVQRPAIRELMPRITRQEDGQPTAARWNRLRVRLRSGQTLEKEIRQLRGSKDLPLSDEALREKWRDCLQHGGVCATDGEAFFDQALHLERLPVRTLMELLPRG